MEVVRKLQEALASVQATRSAHRLSEQNCVEVVRKLVELGQLNVLFTLDGKVRTRPQRTPLETRRADGAHTAGLRGSQEYVTSEHLETEIVQEAQRQGGAFTFRGLPPATALTWRWLRGEGTRPGELAGLASGPQRRGGLY